MSDETPKMTPEEHEILGKAPADTPFLLEEEEGDGVGDDAPEGVVGDDDRPPA